MSKVVVELPRIQQTKTTEKLKWYDTFYQKMNEWDCNNLKFSRVLEKYIETEDGKVSVDDFVEKICKNNFFAQKITTQKYVEENYLVKQAYRIKAIPEVYPQKKKKHTDIVKWFQNYQNYNDSTAEIEEQNVNEVIFEVDDKEVEDFCYDLERNGIRYSLE